MPLDHSLTDQHAPAQSQAGAGLATVRKHRSWKKPLGILAGIVLVLAIVAYLVNYLLVGQYYISTDDAYIGANTTMVATKVSGYVTAVPVRDNQLVRAGDLLVNIDPRDYQAALASANADAEAANAAIASDKAQLALQQTKIAAAQATITGDQARLAFAAQNSRRYASLSGTGASTKQSTDQASTDVVAARAQLAADAAALQGAIRTIAVLDAAAAQATANYDQSKARVRSATLDLGHTQIRAAFDGQIGNKTVSVGDYMQVGTQLMALVPLEQVYVIANYKETQITRMQNGQPVTIVVDGFPSLHVTGHVDSISPASGQEFALLPPDNATGNFTKIVQRVPVKILINLNQTLIGKLRPGMSVEPNIDTRKVH